MIAHWNPLRLFQMPLKLREVSCSPRLGCVYRCFSNSSLCFTQTNLVFSHKVVKKAQSPDLCHPQASQRLPTFAAWLLSYLGAACLLIRRRNRSCSRCFSWLWRKSKGNSLPSCLLQAKTSYFYILLEDFFPFLETKGLSEELHTL